jgi:sulfate adenylyltransferase large subunit
MTAIAYEPTVTTLPDAEEKTLLRLITCGSVDDGKSTLIGRLLYDSQSVLEDHLLAAGKASVRRNAEGIDLALLTDGLRAEREQGITIDVAYRYFATPRRKFILGDTPGHEQYTRNMATGASTADLALLLVDARHGLRTQTRRHARIAALLGIRTLVVTVNKMDLVGWSEGVFARIVEDFTEFAKSLPPVTLHFIPISAFDGANVVTAGQAMPWFDGPPLLTLLETIDAYRDDAAAPFLFPVQRVLRPDQNFRGYSGQIAGGVVRPGDRVVALPSGRTSTVTRISTFDGDLAVAHAPMSVTLSLADELDVSRGDALCAIDDAPVAAQHVEATLIWLSDTPLQPERSYIVKHTTRTTRGSVRRVLHAIDVETSRAVVREHVTINDIVRVELETFRPLVVRRYEESRAAGSFILIDPVSNETVAAGLVAGVLEDQAASAAGRVIEASNEAEALELHRAWLAEGTRVVVVKAAPQDVIDGLLAMQFVVVTLTPTCCRCRGTPGACRHRLRP